ncbi:MAG: B12-binding domain-containing radical SAM protein [Candidatus Odinarchaeota archaeon]
MARFERIMLAKPAFYSALGIMVNEIPHGLEYIAAMIRNEVDKVWIIDFCVEKEKPVELIKRLKPDLIGISSQMSWHNSLVELVKAAKKALSGVKIAVGGYYPTGFPSIMNLYPDIDYLISCEGEYPMLELVMGKPEEEIKNLTYRNGTEVLTNPNRPLIQNLDELPYPARDLRRQITSHLQFPGRIYDVLTTSRGCYGHCSFCCEPFMSNSHQRYRNPEKVFEEIEWLWNFYDKTPLKITISDPNFMGRREADVKRVDRLCDFLIASEFDIDFACLTRADVIARHPSTVTKMIEAGIRTIEIGVESPTKDVLKNTKKGVSIRQTARAVKTVREAGGLPLGTMVLGFHDQTEGEIKLYPVFASKIGLIETAFAFATPLAGTDYFKQMLDEKLITEYDFSRYDYLNPIVKNLKGIKRSRMLQLLGYCYGHFYSREKLSEGQKFYLKAQPEGKPASTVKDLALFALKALGRHTLKEQFNFLAGFAEGKIASWK